MCQGCCNRVNGDASPSGGIHFSAHYCQRGAVPWHIFSLPLLALPQHHAAFLCRCITYPCPRSTLLNEASPLPGISALSRAIQHHAFTRQGQAKLCLYFAVPLMTIPCLGFAVLDRAVRSLCHTLRRNAIPLLHRTTPGSATPHRAVASIDDFPGECTLAGVAPL